MTDNGPERIQGLARKEAEKNRSKSRNQVLDHRRFHDQDIGEFRALALTALLAKLKIEKFENQKLLLDLKQCLASGEDSPDDFFLDIDHLPGLVKILAISGPLQNVATQIVANLAPLSEKNGIHLARSVGPYLVTNLFSGSNALQEASCVALGNMALSGTKVVKVLVNQEVTESLISILDSPYEQVQASGFYALYHILHTFHTGVQDKTLQSIGSKCLEHMNVKCPVELHWVIFVLSCDQNRHVQFKSSSFIHKMLDICTYEIFQKSDSRPLVKIVTPIVRTLSNLAAGGLAESICLNILRYPDLTAILMALLATNYSHLCKETLWLFSNIVNNESVLVQEELIEMDFMDKLEYHTSQAIQKIDPYVTAVI